MSARNVKLNIILAIALVFGLLFAAAPGKVMAAGSIVYIDNLQPSWTAPGGVGVWSAYYGPYSETSPGVSPGNVELFQGREAGIIKAGITIDTSVGYYRDEGLFGFKADTTINDFALGNLSYDVVNQYGSRPVWMTIEIDSGVVDDRNDNVSYQFIPTTNPLEWHTVNAAAGLFQLMDENGNGVGDLKSLSQLSTDYSGRKVVRVYLRLGQGNAYHEGSEGTIGWVDKVTIGEVTYDFVVPQYWYVSPTGSDLNEGTLVSPYLTIQKAIDSAASGDTINVAAGTYTEALLIAKPLTLNGAGRDTTTIAAPAVLPLRSYNSGSNPIIAVDTTQNVVITGFTIDGMGRGNGGATFTGVHFWKSSGEISDSKIINLTDTPFSGMQDGNAVTVNHEWDVNTPQSVIISNNIIASYQKSGILVNELGSTATITNNTITGAGPTPLIAQNGIQVGYGASAQVSLNTISGNNYEGEGWSSAGILLIGIDGSTVNENTIENNEIGVSLSGDTTYGYGGVNNVIITANDIRNNKTGLDSDSDDITGTQINNNQFLTNGLAITNSGSVSLAASPNWFGSITGPVDGTLLGLVDVEPWCGNAACTFTVTSNPSGQVLLPNDIDPEEIQDALDSVPPGTKLVLPPGLIKKTGGFNLTVPNISIILPQGTTIQNNSPCFVVHAAPVTITAATIGGGACVPTNGSNGIDVDAGLTNVIISGIEFSGIDSLDVNQSTGAGIYFHGAVTDVQIVNNYFHDLDGAGVVFGSVTNNQGIQGNLFQRLGGVAISYSGTPDLNAEYNSWNQYAIPTVSAVDADPATHVALYLVSDGTPTPNVVVNGQQITYTVRGDLRNIAGASFILNYDTTELNLVSATSSELFEAVPGKSNVLDITTDGVIKFDGVSTPAITGTAQDLFTVVFTATASGDAPLTFDPVTDLFSMAPSYGPSSNVYAALLDNKTVTVVDPLALTGLDLYESANLTDWTKVFGTLAGGYTMGIDPANEFEYLDAANPEVNRTLADGYYPFYLDETAVPAGFFTYWAGKGVTSTAVEPWQIKMWQIINGNLPMFYLKVSTDGTVFDLIDGLQHELGNDVALRVSGDYPLGAYTFNGSVADGYGFTDALSVQINFIEPLTLTALDLFESVNGTDWTKVFGTLVGGYTMGIDPANQYEFLDALAPTVNRTLADGLYPFFLSQTGLPANFWTYWAGNGVVSGADLVWEQKMWQIINGELPMFYLKVSSAGTVFDLIDGLQHELGSDVALRVSGDYPLGTYAFTGSVADNFFVVDPITVQITFVGFYDVTGTFSMQGRLIRAGVPVALTGIMNPVPFSGTTIDQISSNLSLLDLIADTYIITTDQERYLDVVLTNDKTITVSAAKTAMSPLELKGGDANDDDAVNLGDAAIVGASYGIGTILSAGDVNFDDKVNIFDLALVGGNYNLTSTVYNSWLP